MRERWGPEAGFPRGPVYSIDQTKDGYLWIGTEKGLVRFDGVNFHLMQSDASSQSSMTHVLGLLADTEGGLWVRLRGPSMTLVHYNGKSFSDRMADLAHPKSSASAMGRAWDGAPLFWVLDSEPSAIVLRGGKFETLAAPPNFSRSAVLAVTQTPNGDVWVGTRDAGLFRFAGGKTIAVMEGLPDLKVNALVSAGNNQLWVGTDAGVALWDGHKLTKAGLPPSLSNVVQCLSMTIDRDSNLWVGTNSGGLLRVNSSGAAAIEDVRGDSIAAVTAVFEDREGNLWAGSAKGLYRFRDSAFVTYSLPEGLPSDGSNLDHDVVYAMAGGKDEVWAGRQRGGLTRLRWVQGSIRTKTYTEADGLAQNSVSSVYQARDGSVWAGTLSGGVSRLGLGQPPFTNFTAADGLISNTVNAILESPDGTLWFATPSGISALSDGRWRSFATSDGLPSDNVICMLLDSGGIVWAGTSAGIAFRAQARFQVPAAPAALREQILGIAEDKLGSIWLATSNHVLRLRRDKLMNGSLAEDDVHEYGPADGLRSTEGVKRNPSVVPSLPTAIRWRSKTAFTSRAAAIESRSVMPD